jgi:thiosulfate/3-mercaptopyruvate sulfurtransferase
MRFFIRPVLIVSVAVTLFGAVTSAQTPRDSLLVSTAWLAAHLSDANLVVLHVGDKTAYATQHIRGARQVALADLSVSGEEAAGLNLQMLPVAVLRDRLAALGVSDNSRIVVYSAAANLTSATRIVLTLDYAGLGDRTSLLDGGMAAWTKDGRELTSVLPDVKSGTLSPLKIKLLIVDAAFVRAHLKTPDFAIVDARLAPFYDGTQVGGSPQTPHKTGHIDGAKNIPWSDLTTDQHWYRPTGELQDRFAKAGVKPGDTVVAYCHIGQQATAMIFAARTLGFKVLLYDGSFEDWSKQPDSPVAIIKK